MIGDSGQCQLPNGCTLYWKPNGVGGRIYYSDEVGGGATVWDTCIIEESTLLAAMVKEAELIKMENQTQKEEEDL